MAATGTTVLNKIVPCNYKKNGILYFKCPLTKIKGTAQQLSGEKDLSQSGFILNIENS